MTVLDPPEGQAPAVVAPAGEDPSRTGAPATATAATPETAAGAPSPNPPVSKTAADGASAVSEPEPPLPDAAAITASGTAVGWLHLRVLADTLDDVMQTRISIANRAERAAIEALPLGQYLDGLNASEKMLRTALRNQFRTVAPELRAWTLDTPGLGEPLMARFLGAVGHPLIAQPHAWMADAPDDHVCTDVCTDHRHLVALEPFIRTPRQFISYCGWGDPTRRRRAGMSAADALALGNQRAKSLAYVMATGCIKQNGGRPVNRADAQQVPAAPRDREAPFPRADAEPPAGLHRGSPEENATAEKIAATHTIRPDALSTAVRQPGENGTTCDASSLASTAELVTGRRRSPYRDVYDMGRARYVERDWTPGHQHAAALRLTVKAILLDMWRVSAGLPPRYPSS